MLSIYAINFVLFNNIVKNHQKNEKKRDKPESEVYCEKYKIKE